MLCLGGAPMFGRLNTQPADEIVIQMTNRERSHHSTSRCQPQQRQHTNLDAASEGHALNQTHHGVVFEAALPGPFNLARRRLRTSARAAVESRDADDLSQIALDQGQHRRRHFLEAD